MRTVTVYAGDRLGDYSFGSEHPFGPSRQNAFLDRFHQLGLDQSCHIAQPAIADRNEIERFHTTKYVDSVIQASENGNGYLDRGDISAFRGVYEAAAHVVGTVLLAVSDLIRGATRHAFVPIAGLHRARRNAAAGFLCLQRLWSRH